MKVKFYYVVGFLLGVVLVISGFAKAFNIEAFATEIALFIDAYFFSSFITYRYGLAILACLIEITIGLLYIKNQNSFMTFTIFIIYTFFLTLTGLNYYFPPQEGSVESCGCFGELIHLSPASSFYKNIAFVLMSLYVIRSRNFEKSKVLYDLKQMVTCKESYLLILLSTILPTYSYLFLNTLDSLLYTIIFWIILFIIIAIYIVANYKSIPIFPLK